MMANTNFKCRWAFVSISTIAATFIADLLLPRDESDPISHELVAVSTTGSKERASKWLDDNKVPNTSGVQIYNSFEDMMKSGGFDCVYVSSPHTVHYEHCLAAIKNKRDVLVEKPATMNRPQYEKLCAAAKEHGVVLMEAIWTRYLPATRYLQETLLAQIGHVKRIFSDFSFPIVGPELPASSRFLDKRAGAGAILDMGAYSFTWVDVVFNSFPSASQSTDRVVHASCIPYTAGIKEPVDDINTVIMSHSNPSDPSPAVSIITTSLSLTGSSKPSFGDRLGAKKSAPSVRIQATNAEVCIPFPMIRPQQLYIQWYSRDKLNEKGFETEEVIEKPVERGWGMWYQADVIAKAVHERQGKPRGEGLVIGGEDSLRVLGWIDDARKMAGINYGPELEKS